MGNEKENGKFPRNEIGELDCNGLSGVDKRACLSMRDKEKVDGFPRDSDNNLECHKLTGDDKVICRNAKAGEMARKSIGIKTNPSDEE